MKNLKLMGLALSMLMCCATISAQERSPLNEPDANRPKLFTNLPDRIPVDVTELQSLVSGVNTTGRDASVRFSNEKFKTFRGRVVSTASRDNDRVKSLVLRSDDFNGASFTVTAMTQADGTTKYSGRILSFRHADMYVLENSNGSYYLVKKNFYEVVSE